MRNNFDLQLNKLNRDLIGMGALCESAIDGAIKALISHTAKLANDVISTEEVINEREREIQSLCLKLLLEQQPVARDLRTISAASRTHKRTQTVHLAGRLSFVNSSVHRGAR